MVVVSNYFAGELETSSGIFTNCKRKLSLKILLRLVRQKTTEKEGASMGIIFREWRTKVYVTKLFYEILPD
jgi:hypothetical protein